MLTTKLARAKCQLRLRLSLSFCFLSAAALHCAVLGGSGSNLSVWGLHVCENSMSVVFLGAFKGLIQKALCLHATLQNETGCIFRAKIQHKTTDEATSGVGFF